MITIVCHKYFFPESLIQFVAYALFIHNKFYSNILCHPYYASTKPRSRIEANNLPTMHYKNGYAIRILLLIKYLLQHFGDAYQTQATNE